ncbi:tail fiber domain-containing protein [Xanthomarina sp. F2636L]|uniref:tail fiber domain-containing protein n=1 Tax=Xanthomarina sp. F2636L TaxID=2996018 RepID=UPI00225E6085|nr:tail fiber domain-containing protein [Xanthomarina sp. F2636L]MCX7551854.1 tail fiber domain-containing protein [Xanthomarina sp. F2636L]
MKTLLTFVFTVLFSTGCLAQKGINYKAIIKDANGNVVANAPVDVSFAILQGAAQTNVYQEVHYPTTDNNGLVVLNIGEGTHVYGDYNTIDWANENHFLNIQILTESEWVDMGATEFKTVPYALNAETASNVTGLNALDEGHGIGWRLIGRDPNNHGDIGENAVDLSYSNIASSTFGAIGSYSTALGLNTTASAPATTAMGRSANASAIASTAMGYYTEASGNYSTAMGYYTEASGNYSTAIGVQTIADDPYSTVVGRLNDHTAAINMVFQVGNGITGARSNALNVDMDGIITAPSLDVLEITDPKTLITKEYADTLEETGLEAIDEGNGIGWRLKGRNPNNYGNIGGNAVDISTSLLPSTTVGATGNYATAIGYDTKASNLYTTAMGRSTVASGRFSTAMGLESEASGDYSTAMGNNTTASRSNSTAMGYNTTASGYYSTAMGYNTTASGSYSIAMGNNTTAYDNSSTAVGKYNRYSDSFPISLKRLFMVGNGTSDSDRTNAFTVYENGNASLAGTLTQNSDRRLKKDITPLSYGLETILQLNPVAYNWINRTRDYKSLGLIAQEVQPIINEIVHIDDDEAKTLSVSYTELIPVLIKAIQEQQEIIESQNLTISAQEQTNTEQSDLLQTLLERVEALEKNTVLSSKVELAKN